MGWALGDFSGFWFNGTRVPEGEGAGAVPWCDFWDTPQARGRSCRAE